MMNKIKIILGGTFFVLMVGYHVQKSQKPPKMSDIAIENVEALANTEWIPGKGWVCFKNLLDDTSSNHYFIATFCEDCNPHSATSVHESDYCTYSGMYD